MLRPILVGATALMLAGCAGNKYCLGDQPYTNAPSIPPLQSAEGVDVPQSSAALKIPPPPANPVPFGQTVKNEKGDEVVQCLDRPPPMPKPAEPPPAPEVKPAEPKPSS